MKGSAFIVHNDTWSCSNEVLLDMHSTPVIEGGKMVALKQENTISVYGIFNASEAPKMGDKCQIILMDDDKGNKYGFICEVRAIGQLQIIFNVLSTTDKITEILGNITIKN